MQKNMNIESSTPVKLKGVGDSLWITIDPSFDEDHLKKEIKKIFENLKHLAIGASVVLDFGDSRGHDDLINNLKSFIRISWDVEKISMAPEKKSAPIERIRQRDLNKGWNHHRSDVLMLRGRVRSGQKIETKRHLIITGDVNPGSELIASGDVIVLGKLSGKVHAGYPDNDKAIIFALEFNPTQVRIGTFAAAGISDVRFSKPEFASVKDNTIIVLEYLKANPFGKMPWPEAI